MPYTTHDGTRTYYEVEGSGPPLVLYVGFLGSLADWRRADTRYSEALHDAYRLVLIDPRGQGKSDKPHDPAAYALEKRVGDVLAVLDHLEIDRTHFWGYSLGGRVGFTLAAHAPNRLFSLIAGGADPYPQTVDPETDTFSQWLRRGMAGFVEEWERHIGPLPTEARHRWLAEDAEALAAARLGSRAQEDLVGTLASIRVPMFLYTGTLDDPAAAERAAHALPDATFIALEGLNHPQAFRRSDVVLPHVRRFLDRVGHVPAKSQSANTPEQHRT